MAREVQRTKFGTWLNEELEARKISRRELGRRLNPGDPEVGRRSVARWLAPIGEAVNPGPESRAAIAAAVGADPATVPDDEDDEEAALTRAASASLEMALRAIVRDELDSARQGAPEVQA